MLKVYGAQWCTYCKKVKDFLETNHTDFKFVDIDIEIEESTVLLEKNLTTIPQVFLDEDLIGGYTETVKKFS